MYKAYCCECMRESYLTRAKLVLGDLEIERQTVPGLHIICFFFLTANCPSSIRLTQTRQEERKHY